MNKCRIVYNFATKEANLSPAHRQTPANFKNFATKEENLSPTHWQTPANFLLAERPVPKVFS
jgi:hypothetical protein